MAKKRRYSDDERAEALAALDACGGNFVQAAKASGVPRATLREWAAGRVSPRVTEIRHEKRGPMADALEVVAWKLLDSMGCEDKVRRAGLSQVATSFGIAVDKMRLLREQPTEILGDDLSDEQRAERIAELLDAARTRRVGQAPAANGAPLPG